MTERPKPTKQLLIEICGNNQDFISSVHHGLFETPLNKVYPHLNLDELIVFASQSWKFRAEKQADFLSLLESQNSIYDLFNYANKEGFPLLNTNKKISDKLKPHYEQMNPFKGKNLKERLGMVAEEDVQSLKKRLQQSANSYLFESQYERRKLTRDGNNSGITVMGFQPKYPSNRKQIIERYATQISKMLSEYLQKYQPLTEPQLALSF